MFERKKPAEEWHPISFVIGANATNYIKEKKLKACGVLEAGAGVNSAFWVIRKEQDGDGYEVLCTDHKFRDIRMWTQ